MPVAEEAIAAAHKRQRLSSRLRRRSILRFLVSSGLICQSPRACPCIVVVGSDTRPTLSRVVESHRARTRDLEKGAVALDGALSEGQKNTEPNNRKKTLLCPKCSSSSCDESWHTAAPQYRRFGELGATLKGAETLDEIFLCLKARKKKQIKKKLTFRCCECGSSWSPQHQQFGNGSVL